jgi:hypothetical protein
VKYLVPLLLLGAPLCPHLGLPWYCAVPVFLTGVLFGFAAYGKADVPYVSSLSILE